VIDPEKPTHRNAGVFIVEKGTPGFSIGRKEKKIGIRRSDMVEPVFDECRVPGENLLGEARVEPHLMG
jgi:alkylation response protein AidB-like acyl-CoA dehydrogenase